MGARDDIARLLRAASASMKHDPERAVATLESAYAIAREGGDADDIAVVSEELARGWARRRSAAKAMHYARKATRLAADQKSGWTTLAKTCELIASRTRGDAKKRRAHALYRGAARAFKRAASLTKDREDKHWLLELAGDAAERAKALSPP